MALPLKVGLTAVVFKASGCTAQQRLYLVSLGVHRQAVDTVWTENPTINIACVEFCNCAAGCFCNYDWAGRGLTETVFVVTR
jgi:hypothetical protein